jgi:response regulator NasT
MTRTNEHAGEAGTPKLRALIVEDDTLVGMGLRALLEKLGHRVIAQASNAEEATRFFREGKPELVLMDIRLDQTDGIELAGQLLAEHRVPMIIVSAYSDQELIERAAAVGVYGYLVKPVAVESLAAQIGVALTRFSDHVKLMEENQNLVQTLETRKLVERAKGILMKRLSLAEPDAHRRLQQESQKRRISLAEIAKRIIESEELLSG